MTSLTAETATPFLVTETDAFEKSALGYPNDQRAGMTV